MDTATLIAGHRAITDASQAMLAALAATPVDVNAVARHRMSLSLRVRQQLRDEDRLILPVLRAGGMASLPLAVRDLIDRRALLMRRYSEHVARWTLQALSADIPCFHRETTALVADVIRLMAEQERVLYPYIDSMRDKALPPPDRPVQSLPIAS